MRNLTFRFRSESREKFRPEARREKARPEEGKKGTLCLERKTPPEAEKRKKKKRVSFGGRAGSETKKEKRNAPTLSNSLSAKALARQGTYPPFSIRSRWSFLGLLGRLMC